MYFTVSNMLSHEGLISVSHEYDSAVALRQPRRNLGDCMYFNIKCGEDTDVN